jgi:DNA-directed RNA polymerase
MGTPCGQDGSCNGLQHYAALGRDSVGAASVNLTPSDLPQDVYREVATQVGARKPLLSPLGVAFLQVMGSLVGRGGHVMASLTPNPIQVEEFRQQDAKEGLRVAQVLEGFISRKVVKQTVMTVVYGVTRYGGRLQIEKRLRELSDFPQVCSLPCPHPSVTPFSTGTLSRALLNRSSPVKPRFWPRPPAIHIAMSPQEFVWEASHYLVRQVFKSLQEMFTSTRAIQVRPCQPSPIWGPLHPTAHPPNLVYCHTHSTG